MKNKKLYKRGTHCILSDLSGFLEKDQLIRDLFIKGS